MLENKNVVYGSFLPNLATISNKNSHFKTFEEIAEFSDKMELIEEYKNIQESLLRNIGIPKNYLDAVASVYLKE